MPKQPKWFMNLEDTEQNPLTRDRILNWMVTTGFIDNFTRKRISPLDYKHIDDYIQSVWEEICKIPEEKLITIYRRGKGKFTNYFKALISNQIYSGSSKTYKENKEFVFTELLLDDDQWRCLEESGETNYTKQFPCLNKDKNCPRSERVYFEYDGSVVINSEINLYEDDKNPEEE